MAQNFGEYPEGKEMARLNPTQSSVSDDAVPKSRLTVAIISYNRLHYLKALVESFVECNGRQGIDFILVDNDSKEPGLASYIDSLTFFSHRIVQRSSFGWAINKAVELSAADYLLVLSDDIQFVVRDLPWIDGCVALLEKHREIGSIVLDAQRRNTVSRYFGGWRRRIFQKRYIDPDSGVALVSYGGQKPGIAGAGINTLNRKATWLELGEWTTRGVPSSSVDATLGAEEEMLERYERAGLDLERCALQISVAAMIVTDPGGYAAKIRDGKRFGKYFPPPDGQFYYRIWDHADMRDLKNIRPMPAFEDMVHPMGFELPFDHGGNLIKGNPDPIQTEFESVS